MDKYYEQIKEEIINNEIYSRIKDYSKNKHDLETRYNIGKLLVEAQGGEGRAKYGDNLIKEYSKRLVLEVGKKYNERTLRKIRQFYILVSQQEIWSQLATKLTWSHWIELLPIKDSAKLNYYINLIVRNNLSRNALREKIKSKEYERLPLDTKDKLVNNENTTLPDIIKDPIIISNPNNIDVTKEKALQYLIMENIYSFLKELGEGFTFVGNEYPIKIGNDYNYIDLLLFNYIYNCFVVIELKVTKLKKEHIGQIETYMNYINKNIKTITQDKTIGIILVKKNNTFIMEYSSDKRIVSREYVIN